MLASTLSQRPIAALALQTERQGRDRQRKNRKDDGMSETTTTWRADPLVWGRGPRQFEMFLEPTCPFSAKAFAKLDETLAAAGADKITIKIRLQSQPWHMYSGVIVRCILAASTLPAGKDAAKAVLAAV